MAENIIIDKVVGESGASNSNAIGQSQFVESQVKKGRKKRSRAWDHFSRKTDSDGSEKGVCNYCKKEYFADTKEHGMTSMLTHIAKCPKMPYNIDIKQSKLAFQPIIGSNKGDVVVVPWEFDQEKCRKALCRMVIIDELPFRFVEKEVDNVGSNSVAITELSKQLTKWGTNLMGGSHLHIRCMAHIVNLIVQDGTKEANVCIERVRQAVRYIRQFPARWKKFQECGEDENLAKKSLCLDVPTKWNSTYMMLNRVIEYEGTLLSSDWEGVKRITKFLEMFFNLTLKISGSRYVTSNLHFLEICEVGVYLNQLISNEDHVLAKMAENMKEKFDKYWGDTEKMNKMVFIPCVLDPRHKFSTLGFALKKMFGEKGAAVEISVRTYMESLFNEYTKHISNDKNGQCSSTEVDTSDSSSVGGLGNFFEELRKHTYQRGGASSKSELVKYLDEEIEVGKSDFDVLLWWN
ncbi:zinc finger BED domain-containing protein RICESLEEPER 1-like [Solanum stenotomum]|uniref:zinc finger BED domain-containing protein RICESLEEPER 1-like n=1 Tax=Solanum stenotomum TaxID=172797 RepID=UPI0020D0F990|nr:zinc finger BED domain-containing protein RICESLEEPER 1-like [Solanum stenotomum]